MADCCAERAGDVSGHGLDVEHDEPAGKTKQYESGKVGDRLLSSAAETDCRKVRIDGGNQEGGDRIDEQR